MVLSRLLPLRLTHSMVRFLNVQWEEPGVEAEEVKETADEDVDAISDATEREIA